MPITYADSKMKALRGKATDVRFPYKAAMIRKEAGRECVAEPSFGWASLSQ